MPNAAPRYVAHYLATSRTAMDAFAADPEATRVMLAMADAIAARMRAGGKLLVAGNGGSAADSQHIAGEFISRLMFDHAPLPSIALTTDSSILTAIGNDYGFDRIFERQLAAKATPRDVFLGITTSGESPNIVRALAHCRSAGVPSIVLAGRGGGTAGRLADHCIVVPGTATSTIQELHIVVAHTLCECVETAMFPETQTSRTRTCPATSS